MTDVAAFGWRGAWRIARRDLSARFKGLRLLLVCLLLGTAALTAIGTLTAGIQGELASRGQVILGGDLQVSVWQRPLSRTELVALAKDGRVSQGTRLQAMARHGDLAVPVQLKAVDHAYPLYGALTLKDGRSVRNPPPGEAWLSQDAADRLALTSGQTFAIGSQTLSVGGIIANEPDKLGEGFQFGPTIIVDARFPQAAGLIAPGSMYRTKVRLAIEDGQSPEAIGNAFQREFPNQGFEVRTRDKASPGADRFIARMGDFLTLVGLAALVIAGIGIGGGVTSYLDARRQNIATLKILGATSGDIARIYALEIALAAVAGSVAGIAIGLAITPLLAKAIAGLLPVENGLVFSLPAVLLAFAYGVLVALIFAAPPLLRARHVPAMALMRARIAPLARDRLALVVVGGGLLALCGLALATSRNWQLTGGFLLGVAGMLGLLALVGWTVKRIAAALPRPRSPVARTALANLHRPGSATGALITALGFGLAAFVLLTAVQSAIEGTIAKRVPQQAPDYFVLDVPRGQAQGFADLVRTIDPKADLRTVPMLRGAVLAFGPPGQMTRVADMTSIPEGAWALRGERGLTFSDTVPPGNAVSAGAWWKPGYTGPPEVSVDEDFARAVGLKLGDDVTFGVLGVQKTARVTSFRRIDWQSLGFNFVFVLSPDVLMDAPYNLAATISLHDDAARGPLLRALVKRFPSSSVIEVGDVLVQARNLLGQVGLATLVAAGVTVLAGIAVLLGAIAAARAQRSYDTVILRVLGANRWQVLAMALAEYAALVLVLGAVALALGSLGAWLVVVKLFELDWLPDWGVVLTTLGGGLLAVLAFAVLGSLPLLRVRPAQALRAL
ncbi:FtsX-like permease family protein [Porphyrobacter algicida]|uniref:FtsX-like permease family protein n=1 Tax=Qipengyuania algicida TaxID=1836209 RepID=A0A845AIH2_9SPHN|nr:FtsX-like permease family protein [Qipengyuania algicida]